MKLEITIKVSKSDSGYGDPKIKKEIIIDVPGSDFESLNLPNYIQTTLETSIEEFKQLPPLLEVLEDRE